MTPWPLLQLTGCWSYTIADGPLASLIRLAGCCSYQPNTSTRFVCSSHKDPMVLLMEDDNSNLDAAWISQPSSWAAEIAIIISQRSKVEQSSKREWGPHICRWTNDQKLKNAIAAAQIFLIRRVSSAWSHTSKVAPDKEDLMLHGSVWYPPFLQNYSGPWVSFEIYHNI